MPRAPMRTRIDLRSPRPLVFFRPYLLPLFFLCMCTATVWTSWRVRIYTARVARPCLAELHPPARPSSPHRHQPEASQLPPAPTLLYITLRAPLARAMFASRALLLLTGLAARVLGAQYAQSDSHQGDGFLKSFTHEAISDPTHGRV